MHLITVLPFPLFPSRSRSSLALFTGGLSSILFTFSPMFSFVFDKFSYILNLVRVSDLLILCHIKLYLPLKDT